MAELNRFTQQMQEMLPQWMKMAKDSESVGAQFLDVFGLEFEDVQQYMDQALSNRFIDTADLSQIDISYKIPLDAAIAVLDIDGVTNAQVIGANQETTPLRVVHHLRDFYESSPEENVCIVDRGQKLLYIRPKESLIAANVFAPFTSIYLGDMQLFNPILHHIWNPFDEFGLLLGVQRLYGERNAALKERILDVFRRPGNATAQGLKNGLARELGLEESEFTIGALSDPAFKETLLDAEGNPTSKLIGYTEQVNRTLGFSWGNMSWGDAYWHSIEEHDFGFEYLPHIWDATVANWRDEDFQSGVGDGADLLVRAPEKLDNTRRFNYYVGLRGVEKASELIHPEIDFKYKITAKGTVTDERYVSETYRYTIVASEIIRLHYIIRAFKRYTAQTAVDFTSSTGFRWDDNSNPSLEIVTGETIMSPKKDPLLHVKVDFESLDNTETPQLDQLNVKWVDTLGASHDIVFDTQAQFDGSTVVASTSKNGTFSTTGGSVQLGYGEFYHVIDTREDFKKGQATNVTVEDTGTIRLVHTTP